MLFKRIFPLFEAVGEGSGAGEGSGTLESAIDTALKIVNKDEPAKKDDEPVKKDEPVVQSPADKLWEALNDPTRAESAIAALATAAGWTKKETVEKTEEIKDAIEDEDFVALKEALGDDFSTFAGKLAPALRKIVDRLVKNEVKDLREKDANRGAAEVKTTVESAIKSLSQEFFKTDSLTAEQETELTRLTKKYAPTKGDTPTEYLKDLFKLLPKGKVTEITKREDNNRSDAGARLASGADGKTESGKSDKPSGSMSLDDAAFTAADNLKKT